MGKLLLLLLIQLKGLLGKVVIPEKLAFGKLGEGLLLREDPLVALTLKDALFTFVLGDSRDLSLARLPVLGTSIAFGRPRSLHFAASLRRIVSLLHDFSLGDVVNFSVLVLRHAVLLVQVVRKRLVVLHRPFSIEEETVILVAEFAFCDRSCSFALIKSDLSRASQCSND